MWKTRPFECPKCGAITMSDAPPQHMHDGNLFLFRETRPRFPAEPIDALEAQVEKLEPWLRKTDWYPMTYMMIPSLLSSADLLLLKLEAYEGSDAERARTLHERLTMLRTSFRREPCSSAARDCAAGKSGPQS